MKSTEIIRYFSLDIEATKIAILTGISRSTINKILKVVKQRIAEFYEAESPFETGEIEIDESYFGERRVRGIRGRRERGKDIVFGFIIRGGKGIPRSSETVLTQSFCRLSEKRYKKNLWCIPMVLRRMMAWSI